MQEIRSHSRDGSWVSRGDHIGYEPTVGSVRRAIILTSAALGATLLVTLSGVSLGGLGYGGPNQSLLAAPAEPVGTHTTVAAGPIPTNSSTCAQLIATFWYPSGDFKNQVDQMFTQVCNETQFTSLIQAWGGNDYSNFTLAYGYHTAPLAPDWTVNFAISWVTFCNESEYGSSRSPCSYQAVWTGNLTTDKVSGPTFTEYPAVSAGGPGGPQTFVLSGPTLWIIALLVAAVSVIALSLSMVARSRTGRRKSPPAEHVREPAVVVTGGPSVAEGQRQVPPTPSAESVEEGAVDSLSDIF
jgi:hypothetical protein